MAAALARALNDNPKKKVLVCIALVKWSCLVYSQELTLLFYRPTCCFSTHYSCYTDDSRPPRRAYDGKMQISDSYSVTVFLYLCNHVHSVSHWTCSIVPPFSDAVGEAHKRARLIFHFALSLVP